MPVKKMFLNILDILLFNIIHYYSQPRITRHQIFPRKSVDFAEDQLTTAELHDKYYTGKILYLWKSVDLGKMSTYAVSSYVRLTIYIINFE